MRVLGIDPGLRRTGFGVIDAEGMRLRYVASGTIVVPPALALPERLKVILDNLREVARETRPDVAALEIVFLNTNPASTLLLGQARGAALCALADSALDVHEYTALQIKKAVMGTGRAAKEQALRIECGQTPPPWRRPHPGLSPHDRTHYRNPHREIAARRLCRRQRSGL